MPPAAVVQNTVLTINTGCAVYLPGLAAALVVAEYNPLRFSAITFRLHDPKSTALIFGSGKIVVTGTKSRYRALLAAYKYVNIMRDRVQLPANVYSPVVQNMVASVFVGSRLDLNKLKRLQPQCCNFEPTLFPGLIWRGSHNSSMVVLVFDSGKLVITGAKTRQHITDTYARIAPVLLDCSVQGAPTGVDEPMQCDDDNEDIDAILSDLVADGVVHVQS